MGKPDRYTVRDGEAIEPPKTFAGRLRYLGPSIVISGSIVGSGEIILTAGLGAAAGFVLLWWVLLSCWVKSLVQAELSRYILLSGDTYIRAINRLPGKVPGPRPISVPVALALIAMVPAHIGLGGIVGGAGQALTLLVPQVPSTWATGLVAAVAVVLLVTGSYVVLERTMLGLVLGFTAATLICSITMQFTEYGVTRADLQAGFSFDFPMEYLVLALAVYGYTGVNSSETSAYTYWCIEKGYPSFIGRPGAPGWEERAKGWIKVLQTDVWATLIILTCATLPFYVLGAGVLRALGEQPEGLETLSVLSGMFTQTLGPWAVWLFGIGAFCILFSTTIASVSGGARYIPDYLIELGFMDRDNLAGRRKIIRIYCISIPVFAFLLYLFVQNPVLLVTIGSMTLALMLPIQSGGTLWFQARRIDPRVRPGRFVRFGLWGIFLFELGMAGLVIWFVVL